MELKKEPKFTEIMKNIGNSETIGRITDGILSLGVGFIPYSILNNPELIQKFSMSSSIEEVLENALPWIGAGISAYYFSNRNRKFSLKNAYRKLKVKNLLSAKKGMTKIGQFIAGTYLLTSFFNMAEDGIDAYFKARNLFPKKSTKIEQIQKDKEPLEEIIKKDSTEKKENKELEQKAEKNIYTREGLSMMIEEVMKEKGYWEDKHKVYAQIFRESSFRTNAVSKTGVRGLAQTKKTVFEAYKDSGHNDIHNPEDNFRAGLNYINHLQKSLKPLVKDEFLWDYSYIAYNLGPTNVRYLIKNRNYPGESPYVFVEKLLKDTKKGPIKYKYGNKTIIITNKKAKETRDYLYDCNWRANIKIIYHPEKGVIYNRD
ncbi:transglycosylase SLT domain-containing protein [Candidatus Woesearchaeota archaeon]|nr:transglycosylase SLT domain-containing protein [Candidatus Woesearchaeota archaeon]